MLQILGALALAAGGAFGVWRLHAADRRAYRAGPWPGLTGRGAGILLAHALLLAAGVLVADAAPPRLVWLCLLSLAPLLLVTWVVRMPGVAAAVCGAYLLPRSLLSLAWPELPLPPLVLVAAVLFDVLVWLRRADVRPTWPGRPRAWRQAAHVRRVLEPWRITLASVAYCAVLVVLELHGT